MKAQDIKVGKEYATDKNAITAGRVRVISKGGKTGWSSGHVTGSEVVYLDNETGERLTDRDGDEHPPRNVPNRDLVMLWSEAEADTRKARIERTLRNKTNRANEEAHEALIKVWNKIAARIGLSEAAQRTGLHRGNVRITDDDLALILVRLAEQAEYEQAARKAIKVRDQAVAVAEDEALMARAK